MKIRIEIDESLNEEEIIIRAKELNEDITRINHLLAEMSNTKTSLRFYKCREEYYIPVKNILFFETEDKNVYAHTSDDVYEVREKLFELEDILNHDFMRISKSAIVNVKHIYSINRNITASSKIEFYKTHKQVYVSRHYYKALRDRIDERRNYEK